MCIIIILSRKPNIHPYEKMTLVSSTRHSWMFPITKSALHNPTPRVTCNLKSQQLLKVIETCRVRKSEMDCNVRSKWNAPWTTTKARNITSILRGSMNNKSRSKFYNIVQIDSWNICELFHDRIVTESYDFFWRQIHRH